MKNQKRNVIALAVVFNLIGLLSYANYYLGTVDTGNICTQAMLLSGSNWRLATDSSNTGIQNGWYKNPPIAASRQTPVPWVIQDVFQNYHGVAWYWREFTAPARRSDDGRYLIKFNTADYMAQVWLNGKKVGTHEGGELPFELDVTDVLRYRQNNLLVVRILNPGYEPIDDILLKETPSSLKHHPFTSNAVYNSGGITGDVELLSVPLIRVNDIFVIPDWKTGTVKIRYYVSARINGNKSVSMSFKISEARSGTPLTWKLIEQSILPGNNEIESVLQVTNHKLWSPDDPFLYRIGVSIQGTACVEEKSVRFGFRDFRFEKGYYILNGKRIFLIGCNFSTHYPIGYSVPLYEDMLRRDVINMKALGQNFVRIPFGCPNPRIFDMYDELGILVHQEHYGSWQMNEFGGYDYPRPESTKDSLLKRFERSIKGVILRDRNHPSIVMWGALNENHEGIVFRKAVSLIAELRALDPTRLIVLNSGRFDHDTSVGSMSSPGSNKWDVAESKLKDWHPYVMIPYTPKALDELSGRIPKLPGQKIYISESGLCFPIDLPKELGDYQQWGRGSSDDAMYFRRQYDKFLSDWKRFGLGEVWATQEEYIQDAYQAANQLRETGEAAIRSNPSVVAYTPTNGVADYSMGESVATNFRRLKPELIPSVLLANSKLRWCVSTEPQSIYSGDSIIVRASFSNLDVLSPGSYPATIQVVGPDLRRSYKKQIKIKVSGDDKDPFAYPVLEEAIAISGKPGKYQLIASLDSGGAAMGGNTEFFVSDRSALPAIPNEVVLCGRDSLMEAWLTTHSVNTIPFDKADSSKRQIILIAGDKPQEDRTMLAIRNRISNGSSVVFLSTATLQRGDNTTGWLPLKERGIIELVDHVAGYYRADRWNKVHPITEGLPAGGILDYKFFRNIISINALCEHYNKGAKPAHTFEEVQTPLTYPDETVFGATRISHNYCSGVQIGVWHLGQGKFIVNTLSITANLGSDPAADRLFANILRYAANYVPEGVASLQEEAH